MDGLELELNCAMSSATEGEVKLVAHRTSPTLDDMVSSVDMTSVLTVRKRQVLRFCESQLRSSAVGSAPLRNSSFAWKTAFA